MNAKKGFRTGTANVANPRAGGGLPQHIGERDPVLSIEDLTVAYRHDDAWLEAVRDFSMQIAPGQTYGLVGESGSGKSTVALTIMRYLDQAGTVRQGQIDFDGRDLCQLDVSSLREIWGIKLTMVPQDPLSSLNPSIQIGEQMAEALRHHLGLSAADAKTRSIELLEMVRVPDPERVVRSYPHQISGGMQQRVMIAMALSTEPQLLVLDEPTTALDVTTQAAILDLFRDLIRDRDTAVLYVTHNLGVVARICDRVAVLYASELVEDATTSDLFHRPLHPYTQGLLDSVPQPGDNKNSVRLQAIPGQIPSLQEKPSGCVFAPRCPLAIEICHQERPALDVPIEGRRVRCHRWPEILSGSISARTAQVAPDERTSGEGGLSDGDLVTDTPVLNLEDLHVHFDVSRSASDVLARRPAQKVKAVDGVDLTIGRGFTLGLVGESGSGKTSLARAVIGLEKATGGKMELLGMSLPSGISKRTLEMMRHLQIVFQNPEEALNPYHTVGETLRRPLMKLSLTGGQASTGQALSRKEADEAVTSLLADVRLPAEYAQRRPGQLSGGEKQRVAIARAFAANPDLLISDEPVSALDVSVQASILNLLHDLQAERGTSNLFISHNLAVVGYLADQIAVIYAGSLMELAGAEDLFKPPYHPYTEALLGSILDLTIPLTDPDAPRRRREHIRLEGDVPDQLDAEDESGSPVGCPFHNRCPRLPQLSLGLGDICAKERPPWQETKTGKRIFCHIPIEELEQAQRPIFDEKGAT